MTEDLKSKVEKLQRELAKYEGEYKLKAFQWATACRLDCTVETVHEAIPALQERVKTLEAVADGKVSAKSTCEQVRRSSSSLTARVTRENGSRGTRKRRLELAGALRIELRTAESESAVMDHFTMPQ